MITLIVAMDPNNGIGLNGQLPWHIKDDLKLFKEKTLNHKVVMGRKTFESIGRPLPNRENFIVTRNKYISKTENVKIIHDFEDFLKLNENSEEEVFIIGGAEIYQLSLQYANRLAISRVYKEYMCDTFFPLFNMQKYKELESKEFDEFKFTLLEKI